MSRKPYKRTKRMKQTRKQLKSYKQKKTKKRRSRKLKGGMLSRVVYPGVQGNLDESLMGSSHLDVGDELEMTSFEQSQSQKEGAAMREMIRTIGNRTILDDTNIDTHIINRIFLSEFNKVLNTVYSPIAIAKSMIKVAEIANNICNKKNALTLGHEVQIKMLKEISNTILMGTISALGIGAGSILDDQENAIGLKEIAGYFLKSSGATEAIKSGLNKLADRSKIGQRLRRPEKEEPWFRRRIKRSGQGINNVRKIDCSFGKKQTDTNTKDRLNENCTFTPDTHHSVSRAFFTLYPHYFLDMSNTKQKKIMMLIIFYCFANCGNIFNISDDQVKNDQVKNDFINWYTRDCPFHELSAFKSYQFNLPDAHLILTRGPRPPVPLI